MITHQHGMKDKDRKQAVVSAIHQSLQRATFGTDLGHAMTDCTAVKVTLITPTSLQIKVTPANGMPHYYDLKLSEPT